MPKITLGKCYLNCCFNFILLAHWISDLNRKSVYKALAKIGQISHGNIIPSI